MNNEKQCINEIREWLNTPLLPNGDNNPYTEVANYAMNEARKQIALILEMNNL